MTIFRFPKESNELETLCDWCHNKKSKNELDFNGGLCGDCTFYITMKGIDKNDKSTDKNMYCDNYLECGELASYHFINEALCSDCYHSTQYRTTKEEAEENVDVEKLTPKERDKYQKKFINGLREALSVK